MDSWKPTVLDAFQHGKVCIYAGHFMPVPLPQSEDCLSLNIYIPGKTFLKFLDLLVDFVR